MKIILILFSTVFYFNGMSADTINYSCKYRYIKQTDPANKKSKFDDVMILTISKNTSLYYSYLKHFGYRFQENEFKKIEESKVPKNVMIDGNSSNFGNYYTLNEPEVIETNYTKKTTIVTDKLISEEYTYSEPIQTQKWVIKNESKTILGQNCQRAETQFKGRNYIAWFAPSIPFKMGPWLFNGLPGLILQVYDDKNQFEFSCLELNTPLSSTKVFKKYVNPKTISKNKLKAKKKLLAQNPIEFMQNEMGKTVTSSGGNVSRPNKPYNPIDLTL